MVGKVHCTGIIVQMDTGSIDPNLDPGNGRYGSTISSQKYLVELYLSLLI